MPKCHLHIYTYKQKTNLNAMFGWNKPFLVTKLSNFDMNQRHLKIYTYFISNLRHLMKLLFSFALANLSMHSVGAVGKTIVFKLPMHRNVVYHVYRQLKQNMTRKLIFQLNSEQTTSHFYIDILLKKRQNHSFN